MSLILLFSDLHAHGFSQYATLTSDGVNSRLADAVSIINQVHQIAEEHDVDMVLFGGDMFHIRKVLHTQTFNMVFEAMAKFAVSKIPTVLIHGNHDQSDRAGTQHSLFTFNTFLHVISEPEWNLVEGRHGNRYNILGIPYTENVAQLQHHVSMRPKNPGMRIQLSHLGVQGAIVGADFVYANPHDPRVSDLGAANFHACFLGHYHQHQMLADNAWYIGAPLHHNWGDRFDPHPRGCLLYDTETGEIERIPLQAPRFVVCDGLLSSIAPEHEPQACYSDYIRWVTDEVISESDRQDIQNNLGCRSLEIVPKNKASEIIAPRLQVTPHMSTKDMVDAYVKSGLTDADGLDPQYLLQMGHELLEEAQEDE